MDRSFTKGFERLHTKGYHTSKEVSCLSLGQGKRLNNQQMYLLRERLAKASSNPSEKSQMGAKAPNLGSSKRMNIRELKKPIRKQYEQIRREQSKLDKQEPRMIPRTKLRGSKSVLQDAYLEVKMQNTQDSPRRGKRVGPRSVPQVFLL